MASAGIATALSKGGHDIEAEANGSFLSGFLHLHRYGEGSSGKLNLQFGLAIGNRLDDVVFKLHQCRVGKGVLGVLGYIARGAVGKLSLQHDLLLASQRHEMGLLWVYLQVHQILRSGAQQERRGEQCEKYFFHCLNP